MRSVRWLGSRKQRRMVRLVSLGRLGGGERARHVVSWDEGHTAERGPSRHKGYSCIETSVKLKRLEPNEWMVGSESRETVPVRRLTEAHWGCSLVFGVVGGR